MVGHDYPRTLLHVKISLIFHVQWKPKVQRSYLKGCLLDIFLVANVALCMHMGRSKEANAFVFNFQS